MEEAPLSGMRDGYIAVMSSRTDPDIAGKVRQIFSENGGMVPLSVFRNALVERFNFSPLMAISEEEMQQSDNVFPGSDVYRLRSGIVYRI